MKLLWDDRGLEVDFEEFQILTKSDVGSFLEEHGLIVIRRANFKRSELVKLAQSIGSVFQHSYSSPVYHLKNTSKGLNSISSLPWHQDLSFLASPPRWGLLYAIDVGEPSGRTIWCHHVVASRGISSDTLSLWKDKKIIHSAAPLRADDYFGDTMSLQQTESTSHDLLKTNYFGESYPFFNSLYCDPDNDVYEPIKDLLYSDKQRHYSHCWQKSDLLLFDNFQTSHCREPTLTGNRHLLRIHIQPRL